MENQRIFISYATKDARTAKRVCEHLENSRYEVWIAPRNIPHGQPYPKAIIEGIDRSSAVVLLLSRYSNKSRYVEREIERAVSKNKPILTAQLEELAPSQTLEFLVSLLQMVDAFSEPEGVWLAKLSEAIRSLSVQDKHDAKPIPTIRPGRCSQRTVIIMGAIVVVIATVTAFLAGSSSRFVTCSPGQLRACFADGGIFVFAALMLIVLIWLSS